VLLVAMLDATEFQFIEHFCRCWRFIAAVTESLASQHEDIPWRTLRCKT